MSNVFIDKNKIDLLANAISAKSGESLTLTLDEMVEAVDGIESGGGITPTGNIDISSAGVTDVTNYATATVPSATISAQTITPVDEDFVIGISNSGLMTADIRMDATLSPITADGFAETTDTVSVSVSGQATSQLSTQAAKTVTPTESTQTAVASHKYTTGAVTVGAISSTYVGSGITQRTSSDLTASGATVSVPAGYYANAASKSVTSGTAGTPTATKGAVNNHSVSVTPSVTNTTGYITGSTKTGTAVSVSASELVSGTLSVTQNGTADVTNYASVDVSVSGGGGMSISTASTTLNAANASISFTGLQDEPTSFVITTAADLATGASPYKTATVVYDGTNVFGQYITNTNNANVTYATTFSQSYNNGTLTVSGTGSNFQANEYKLVYTYGGSSYNIATSDVQVGSGATSITFTGLTDEPSYFSLAFKSDFGTSSGYQRVITVVYDGNTTYGLAMDSSAKVQTSWSYTYNNGTLTISSSGTNAGGYFHQPGYYQLTYGIGGTVELDIQPLNVTTNGTYQQSGVAYSPVTVNVSSGGGSSKNAQSVQGTTRTTSSTLTAIGAEMTVSKTGTYDVYWSAFRSNTSTQYTFGTQLYINGTGYGSEQTTWSNHIQNVHLSNVSLTANDTIRVYGRESRGSSYYMYAGTLTIIEA